MRMESKGIGIVSYLQWLRQQAGTHLDACLSQEGGIPRRDLEQALAQQWYPIAHFNTLTTATALLAEKQSEPLPLLMRQSGAYVAEDNLSTVYKLVLKLASPSRLLNLLPRMWATYFRPIQVEVARLSECTGRCVVRGVGDARHLSPIALGWIDLAYRKVGTENPQVREAQYSEANISPDTLVFDIEW